MAPLNPLQAWIPALKRQREVQYKSCLKKYRFKLKSSYLFFSSLFVLFLSDDKILKKKRVTCIHPSMISSPIHCSERTLCCLNITVVVIDITDLPNKANIHRRKDRNVMFFLVFFYAPNKWAVDLLMRQWVPRNYFTIDLYFVCPFRFEGRIFFRGAGQMTIMGRNAVALLGC